MQHVAFFKYLKATGLNFHYGRKLKSTITDIEYIQRKIGVLASLLNGLREPLTILVVVLVIILQIKWMNADLGTVILSLLFLYRALTFLMALQDQWNRFLAVSGSLENMKSFISELNSGKENVGSESFNRFQRNIVLKSVSFSYENNKVLDNVSLEIKKNETLAIVGESGSGKSTLINIFSGLILPQEGSMRIDDLNIYDLELNSYRQRIGYIAQDAPDI